MTWNVKLKIGASRFAELTALEFNRRKHRFVAKVKKELAARAMRRQATETDGTFTLREGRNLTMMFSPAKMIL